MLHHQDRAVGGHAADEGRDAVHVLPAHAGHGLVEKHHLRVEGEGRGDLQRPLAAVGQLHGRDVGEVGKADGVDQAQGLGVEGAQHALGAPEVEGVAALALERDADVLQGRQVREHGGDLEGAHEAEPGDVGRSERRDVAAVVGDPALGRGQELGEQVEAGGLAGAVRADQRVDGAAAHVERHTVDGGEALEFLGQVRGREDDVAGHAAPWMVLFLRRFSPAVPLGLCSIGRGRVSTVGDGLIW